MIKRKFYILALTFLCLLIGQLSYGQCMLEGDWDMTGNMTDGFELKEVVGTAPAPEAAHEPEPEPDYDFNWVDDSILDAAEPETNQDISGVDESYSSDFFGDDFTAFDDFDFDNEQNSGKPYVPKPNDVKVQNIIGTMPIQNRNTCVTSSLEYASNVLGSTINEGTFILHQLQLGTNVYEVGVPLENISTLINTFFNTAPFLSYIDSINSGYPVMTDTYSGTEYHNVVIVGYQDDGDLIYMNPESGYLEEAPAGEFNLNYAIPIISVK